MEAEYGGKECKGNYGKTVTMSDGQVEESRACQPEIDVPQCPVVKGASAFWSSWQPWSPCPVKCGETGVTTRKRLCLKQAKKANGKRVKLCPGEAVQEAPCDNVCPKSELKILKKVLQFFSL